MDAGWTDIKNAWKTRKRHAPMTEEDRQGAVLSIYILVLMLLFIVFVI